MSRLNVGSFRHPDATADAITLTNGGDTQINRALGLGGATYGTSGQVLTSAGSGAVPTWTTPTSLSNAEDGTGTDFEFNSGFGSNATAYGVRAWIQFDGTATTIGTGNESGNMDAVTDNGTGDYTMNFTNNMPDGNYAVSAMSGRTGTTSQGRTVQTVGAPAVGSVRFQVRSSQDHTGADDGYVSFFAIR